jgi:hypothetical protein
MARAKTRQIIVWSLVAVILVVLAKGVFDVVLFSLETQRDGACRALCLANEHSIAQALIGYQAMNGRFPPAYAVDKNGKPLYSWRVLILPFLDGLYDKSFHEKFNYDEPWDSPNNKKVLDSIKMPNIFSCPSAKKPNETNYVMIVGSGAVSDGPKSASTWDITDGSANTLLVVETCDSGIHWAEPRDLTLENVLKHLEKPEVPGIQSHHRNGQVAVSFCDGHLSTLQENFDPIVLKSLITIAGGEEIK